tara:strand:- start:2372 stop:2842 length:471 start_codon:yes stop_codon:yes gene_type:complete
MKMSGEQKLAEFLQAVEGWTKSKYLAPVNPPEDIELVLNASADDIKSWNSETCNINAFKLYAYAEYIETENTKEKNILEWSESSIWFIISGVLNQYGGQYSKWQEKYYGAVRENPLASEILKIKNHAEARVRTLEGKHNRIIKMAETLSNIARRKQ